MHDAEKIWKRLPPAIIPNTATKAWIKAAHNQHLIQRRIIKQYHLTLTKEHYNALKYVHGEGDDYRKDKRVAGPLAGFCHDCDYWSARGWFDEPRKSGYLPDVFKIIQ